MPSVAVICVVQSMPTVCIACIQWFDYKMSPPSLFVDKLFITGGTDVDMKAVDEVNVIDVKNGVCNRAPAMNYTRRLHAVVTSSKYLFVLGGQNSREEISPCEFFNPQMQT